MNKIIAKFSLGMVVRDDKGKFIKGKNMKIYGSAFVIETEARGVQEAIRWIEDIGIRNVTIECDSESCSSPYG